MNFTDKNKKKEKKKQNVNKCAVAVYKCTKWSDFSFFLFMNWNEK